MELMEKEKMSFRKTEIGLIPKDWNLEKIEEFAKIKTGDKDTQDRLEEGLYPFYVRSQKVEGINSYSFDGEAVLTSGDGVGVGKIYHYLNGKFDYHQRVYNIHNFRNNVSGKYFYYYFSNHFYDRVMSMTAKSSVDSVRREMISEMLIPLPPTIEEQKAIATALSDTDALIAGLEKLISKKKAIKQGAMQQLLTPPLKGGKRLPGFNGEWEEKRLGDFAEVKDGTHQTPSYTSSGIPFYSVENVTKNDFRNTKFISLEDHMILTRTSKIELGDILMTRIGSIGDCKLVDWEVNASYYVSLALLKISSDVHSPFIAHYSKTNAFKKEIDLNSLLSAIPKKINLGPISELKISLPSIEEQKYIAKILTDMDKEIEVLESKKAKYEQLKQGMMQELLTGKTRLV